MRLPLPPFAALVLAAGLVAACGDGPAAPARTTRTFSGRLGGEAFAGEAYASRLGGGAAGDTLYVGGAQAGSATSREVSVSVRIAPFTGPGRYVLAADAAQVVETVGGDGIVGWYASAGPAAGTVVVTAYDAARGTVEGTAEFSAQRKYNSGAYGAAVRFEAGAFRAAIRNPGMQGRAAR